jgi:hypothetical protein
MTDTRHKGPGHRFGGRQHPLTLTQEEARTRLHTRRGRLTPTARIIRQQEAQEHYEDVVRTPSRVTR